MTDIRGTIFSVPPRLAAALGLTTACAMLTAVGVIAIVTAGTGRPQSALAGAVRPPDASSAPAGDASTTAPSRPVDSLAMAPASGVPTAAGPAPAPSGQGIHARQSAGTLNLALAVFQAMNRARAAKHLAALRWDARLQQSAQAHNRAMASANTLSHQVESEPPLGGRESSAGVRWTYAAENIGWTTDRTLAGVLDIQARMLAENPPNDAHRRNILARQARTAGVDVYYDAAHGRLWLTEDFAGNA